MNIIRTLNTTIDPLEQFDVLSIVNIGALSLNNITTFLALNMLVFGLAVASVRFQMKTVLELVIEQLYDLLVSIVRGNLYIQKQQFFAVLFVLFMTILVSNVVGMIPYAYTITSSFILTLFLSFMHFLGVNHVAITKHGWKVVNLFLPGGAPLAIAPFIILIEFVSYVARGFSLSIRLFANMMAGHSLLKILIGFSWALITSGTALLVLGLFPWVIVTAIFFLELLIAFLQAYVFTILVTLYINDVLNMHD